MSSARGARCGSAAEGAQFCLFEAADATLSTFRDVGSLFTINHTLGQIDGDIVWINRSTTADTRAPVLHAQIPCSLFLTSGDLAPVRSLQSLSREQSEILGELRGLIRLARHT